MSMERERCHSLMDKSTDNKYFKSAVNTSFESRSHGRRPMCEKLERDQMHSKLKYIFLYLPSVSVHAVELVHVNDDVFVCMCLHS